MQSRRSPKNAFLVPFYRWDAFLSNIYCVESRLRADSMLRSMISAFEAACTLAGRLLSTPNSSAFRYGPDVNTIDHSTRSRTGACPIQRDTAKAFFVSVLTTVGANQLPANERFTVYGTATGTWARLKSFKHQDTTPPREGSNATLAEPPAAAYLVDRRRRLRRTVRMRSGNREHRVQDFANILMYRSVVLYPALVKEIVGFMKAIGEWQKTRLIIQARTGMANNLRGTTCNVLKTARLHAVASG